VKERKALRARGKAAVPRAARAAKHAILGEHPSPPHPFGEVLLAKEGKTKSKVPHRALTEKDGRRATTMAAIRQMLIQHHASPEALERGRQQREVMRRLGFKTEQARLRRFPTNDATRKGNLAEVVLAEYIVATNGLALPVYRLRYNPNIDQSMKGDDVLAFDLDVDPVRVVVGEAKFRAASSAAAVKDIVAGLVRSHKGGVPVSLQFVADRLFETGQAELGTKVLACARLFALGKLRLDYVGMLFSDARSADRVDRGTPAALRRLAMISLGVLDPERLVAASYKGLK
jgi:HamA